jgi:hypothetical protein
VKDISLHILDIVENSIRAEALRVEIRIREDEEKDLLNIEIRDNGRGIDKETLNRLFDPFITTKTTSRIGLGLPLLAESARQSGGDIDVQSTVGEGTIVRADFRYSNIDRKPLGDMVNTLITLIIGNPHVDFSYTHEKGEKQFSLDTADIKKELDDVPLNHPEVVKNIRNYLQEGFEELGIIFY